MTTSASTPNPSHSFDVEPTGRWRILMALCAAELLAMSLWFSGSAVAPLIGAELDLSSGAQAWLTMSVQLGFVVGALASAVLNLADRVRLGPLFALGAVVGAIASAAVAIPGAPFALILALRFITGAALACVYPTGMKLMATWFRRGRGLAIGALVGALAVGSAAPHGLAALTPDGGDVTWRAVLLLASGLSLVGAIIALLALREGPLLRARARFDWRQAGRVFTVRGERLANLGYLGHMWELYAMWTWAPLLVLESFRAAGMPDRAARLTGFALIAIGGVACVLAGAIADRAGRTIVTIAAMSVSGLCALGAGFLFDAPVALAIVCLVWGFAVIPDSAQFSAAISEMADPAYVGTALTMQTCAGFLLTMVSIRLVPALEQSVGWGPAMAALALGPLIGVIAMARLRAAPESRQLASGRR